MDNDAATKAGVIGLTKTWARDLGPKGVRVNTVCPALVKTVILETTPDEVMHKRVSKVPLGRLGTPEEIAAVYTLLALDDASDVSGAVNEPTARPATAPDALRSTPATPSTGCRAPCTAG